MGVDIGYTEDVDGAGGDVDGAGGDGAGRAEEEGEEGELHGCFGGKGWWIVERWIKWSVLLRRESTCRRLLI